MRGSTSTLLAIKGMLSFFTILPIGIGQKHVDSMNREFWLVPIIGLFYGLFAGVVFCFTCMGTTRLIAAAVTILLVGIMNRFLHFDGVVDTGDGLIVAGKKKDHIRALKDTLVGAGGIVTGIMVTILLFAEYCSLSIVKFTLFAVSAEIIAKNSQVVTAAFGIAGGGMAGDSVRCTTPSSSVKSTILSIAIISGIYFVWRYLFRTVLGDCSVVENCWIAVVVGLVASIVWGFLMSKIANQNFGSVNGDILGATNETSRVVAIFFMILIDSFMVW